MGRWKALFPFLIAVIIAGAGGLMLYKYMQRATPLNEVKTEVNTVSVVVAAVDISRGAKIDGEMIKTAHFIKETLPEGTFDDQEKLSGRVTITHLKLNEPIFEHRLAPIDITVGGVAAVLPPGKRAVAIKGNNVIGLSGLIKPGNIVDVFVTIENPETEEEVTKLILDKIPVLATGTEIDETKEGAQPVDVFTLEVTPEDGEKLALAATQGELQLALRNMLDQETVLTKGVTISDTLASLTEETPTSDTKPQRRSTAKPKQRMHTVRIIRDGNIVEQQFPY